jgi:hypothetical protein
MTTLILKGNSLLNKKSGTVLGNMLKSNTVLTKLDVSDNAYDSDEDDGPGFAQELALGIRDNGALSVANVMGNCIGKEQLAKLQEIMRSKPNLVSLCGIADDATEADLSGLGMDAGDAAILASELPDKGALSSLNLASNDLGKLLLPEGWSEKYGNGTAYGYTHGDGREQKEAPAGSTPEGAIAIANAIKDMRALSLLNLSSNKLCGVWTDARGNSRGTFDSAGNHLNI